MKIVSPFDGCLCLSPIGSALLDNFTTSTNLIVRNESKFQFSLRYIAILASRDGIRIVVGHGLALFA